jgi:hypothetical protein
MNDMTAPDARNEPACAIPSVKLAPLAPLPLEASPAPLPSEAGVPPAGGLARRTRGPTSPTIEALIAGQRGSSSSASRGTQEARAAEAEFSAIKNGIELTERTEPEPSRPDEALKRSRPAARLTKRLIKVGQELAERTQDR